MEQTALVAALCARLPEYKSRHPEAKDALERYYPDFVETYQPELAELLIDHGFCVISTRRSIESVAGKPMESVWNVLKSHLAQGNKAIIHVPKHYLALVGIDLVKQELHFVDTLMPDEFKIYSLVLEPDKIKEAMEARSAVIPAGKAATTWAGLKEKRGK